MFLKSPKGFSAVLVIITFLVLALMIAGGIAFYYSQKKSKTVVVTKDVNKGIILSIDKPQNETLYGSDTVTVSGTTGINTVVSVIGTVEAQIVQTKNAKFDLKVTLKEGTNKLVVYAFDPTTGENVQQSLDLLYLKDILGVGNMLFAQENSSDSTSETVKNLKEKLATESSELKKSSSTFKKTFVQGTIFSISPNLTIATKNGVKSIFVDDFTTFLSIDNKSRSTIAQEDLKTGEQIAVVGLDSEDVSGLSKYIVRLKTTPNKNHAVLGKVKEIDGSALILSNLSTPDQNENILVDEKAVISFKNSSEKGSLTDIKTGDVLVTAGRVNEKGEFVATKVFINKRFTASESNTSTTSSNTSN